MYLIRTFFKGVTATVFMIDHQGIYSVYTVGCMTFCYALFMLFRYRNIIYYRKSVNGFTSVCDATLFWVSLVVLTHVIF